jgi:uncharacterized membrane protein YhaH (DUF805 family)
MAKDKALTAASAWAVIYVVFAGFLVLMLLVVDYIINHADTYPGYDLNMFWFGPHLPFYLTWPEILFNWDAVVGEMPYDIMGALFMAGFAVTFIRSNNEAALVGSIPRVMSNEKVSVVTRVSRIARDPAFIPLVVAGAIVAIAFIGSAGPYGYQFPGLDGVPIFFTGLDDFSFTSHFLPFVLFFSGLFATGFLPLINAARAKVNMKKEGLLLVFAAVLMLSVFYAISPVHYEYILPPMAIIYLVKWWLVSLVVTGYAIALHVKRLKQDRGRSGTQSDTRDENGNRKDGPQARFVVDIRVGLITGIPAWILIAIIIWEVVAKHMIFSEHPVLLFQHTFNMVLTCLLAIGLMHVAERFLIVPRETQNAAGLSIMPVDVTSGIQEEG